jgi:hypothetical protein
MKKVSVHDMTHVVVMCMYACLLFDIFNHFDRPLAKVDRFDRCSKLTSAPVTSLSLRSSVRFPVKPIPHSFSCTCDRVARLFRRVCVTGRLDRCGF